MRKLTAILAFAALLLPAIANAHPKAPDSVAESHVIHVATRGDGPVHDHITLSLNKAVIVQLDTDARDVMVSNPSIVDAVVRTPRRIFLLATQVGQTNAFFFDGQGHQLLSLDVRVERDFGYLADMIKQNLPGADVKVSMFNDNIVLTGTVNGPQESSRAADLAARFASDPGKPVDPTRVVNLLRVQGSQQVMLRVRVAEMQRQIAKQFGINLEAAGLMASGYPFAASTANPFGLMGTALSDLSGGQVGQICAPTSTVPGLNPLSALQGGGSCNLQSNMQGSLQALEQVGLMHTLAEPNLTAVSGETAKFLAGGEFPVPTGRDLQGNITIEFKQFGVGLAFTPVVLGTGRISLQVSTEVSELTNTGAFTEASQTAGTTGITIPALNVRRAETTVELPSGGSFAIAGLMQHTTKQVIDGFPGMKDLPVLGALFRSRDFQNDETELVVLITAYLVNPTTPNRLVSPTDGFEPPSDVQTILNGKINKTTEPKPVAAPPPPGAQANASAGYIVK